jgi:hypothetical protein
MSGNHLKGWVPLVGIYCLVIEKFAANIDMEKIESPKSLNIITGRGMSYRRPDGINVISLASLGY